LSKATRPFYRGEHVDLIVPALRHVEETSWPDWMNSQRTNRYTSHAILANTLEDQRAFYDSLRSGSRFALLITRAGDEQPIGVVSLSGLDFRQGSAAIAIVMDTETDIPTSPLASLESMAIMTQHGFDVMGLNRIDAGQAFPELVRWNRLLEILGYRAEGFKKQAFVRGHDTSDVVILACLYDNYRQLKVTRNGRLWPGTSEAQRLIRALPKKAFAELLHENIRALELDYFSNQKE
jgi:RimJ/RimL family protein N-acetyltransferase